jgi:hypothetical protein
MFLMLGTLTSEYYSKGTAAPLDIDTGETVNFKTTWLSSGAAYYQGQYVYAMVKQGNETLLRQTGTYTFANGNKAEEVSLILPKGNHFLARSFSLRVTNPAGKVIRTERMDFDNSARRVRVVRTYSDPTLQDDMGTTDQVDKIIQVPPDTFPRQMFDAIIRTMDLSPGAQIRLNCITRLGEVYGMYLKEDGTEVLTTPAGRFDTVRVRIVPDIPLLPRLMPSLTIRLWYTRQEPRLPVKFEGYPQPPPPKLQNEVRMVVTSLIRSAN